jgi:hypothetical protein
MPWELGYFDGSRPMRVAVLPLVEIAGQVFRGQEYLGLYPKVQDIGAGHLPKLGFKLGDGRLLDIRAFVDKGVYLSAGR